jgi:ABC-2 type transport system permease protein
MPVYKLSLRIIKQNFGSILLFLSIFLGISILASNSSLDPVQELFTQTKVPIAFFAEESTDLVDGLRQQLERFATIRTYPDDHETLLDAMFFSRIHLVVRVPEGFTQDFLEGRTPQLITSTGPNQGRVFYVDMAIDAFMNTIELYRKLLPGQTLSHLVDLTLNDISQSIPVEFYQSTEPRSMGVNQRDQYFNSLIFFNYQAYSLFAILILGISANLVVFNSRSIRTRLMSSPLSSKDLSYQLFGANFLFALVCWFLINGISFIFAPELIGTIHMGLFLVNSLLLTFWASCISFFIAHLSKSPSAVSAITNIVAMGSGFLSGVFVPQQFLGPTVLRVASFTPSYWFILANTSIADISSSEHFFEIGLQNNPLVAPFLMQAGFGIAFLFLTLLIRKKAAMNIG